MSTSNECYEKPEAGFSGRLFESILNQASHLAQTVVTARDAFVRIRRLRATETALDTLPESIRDDIGWPDLYERQVDACHDLKRRSH